MLYEVITALDILRSNHCPLVMEVNSSPCLEGIEMTSEVAVADAIIEYIEKDAADGKTRDGIGV